MLQTGTLKFLKDLKKNNNREWFEQNRTRFESAKKDFDLFIENLIAALSALSPELKSLQPKDCIFRIYRDVRFSRNKDPFKTNFGASIKAGGRKSSSCGLYLHVEPSGDLGSFIAGGYWMPDGPLLKKIRQEIEYNHEEFRAILENRNFRKHFRLSAEHSLKNVPRGMDPGHPAADLLKFTSYVVLHDVSAEEFTKPGIIKDCITLYKSMLPFLQFLNRIND